MTHQLRAAVAALLATARAANPTCPGWQLTMNPETFLLLNLDQRIPGGGPDRIATYYDGCRVWPEPTWPDTVVCSPLVDAGTWDLPPEYYLDLRDNSISANPPTQTRTIRAEHAAPTG